MPLTIRVHENRATDMWWSDALAILKGKKAGDKEIALETLTYKRGDWVVIIPRTGHTDMVVIMPNSRNEQEAIRKSKRFAEKKYHIYDINDTKPITAIRRLLDEDELPDEYKCPAEYKNI